MAHVGGYGFSSSTLNTTNTSENVEHTLVGSKSAGVISTINKLGIITANPSTSTITATNFNGFIKTVSTTAATPHYLNFSDSFGTGFGNPQKVASLSVIPSTGVVTAGGLNVGNLTILPTGSNVTFTNTTSNILEMLGTFRVNSSSATSSSISIASSGTNTAPTIEIAAGNGVNATGDLCLGATNNKIIYIGVTKDVANTASSTTVSSINIGTNNVSGANFTGPVSIGGPARLVRIGSLGMTSAGPATITGTLTGTRIASTEAANTAGQIGFVTANTAVNLPTVWTQNGTSDTNPWRFVATITIPAKQVSLIIVSVIAENKTAGVSNTRYGVVVSATQGCLSASDTQITGSDLEIAVGLGSFQEPNMDSAVGVQDRRNLVGVYVNSSASTVTAYLNIQWKQAWTTGNAPTFSYNYTITKIG